MLEEGAGRAGELWLLRRGCNQDYEETSVLCKQDKINLRMYIVFH